MNSEAGRNKEEVRPDRVTVRTRKPSLARKPRLSAGKFPVEVRKMYQEDKKLANVPNVVFDEAYDLVDGDISRLSVAADGQSVIIR